MKVITNNKPRLLLDFNQLPEKIQNELLECHNIDCLETGDFFKYENIYYYLGEFLRFESNNEIYDNWDGYTGLNAFCAIVVKYCEDTDYIIVGKLIS